MVHICMLGQVSCWMSSYCVAEKVERDPFFFSSASGCITLVEPLEVSVPATHSPAESNGRATVSFFLHTI